MALPSYPTFSPILSSLIFIIGDLSVIAVFSSSFPIYPPNIPIPTLTQSKHLSGKFKTQPVFAILLVTPECKSLKSQSRVSRLLGRD